MASRFTNFMRRNSPVIDSILGNISDIIVKRNFNDVMQDLEKFENERKDYNKFSLITNSLNQNQLTEEDAIKPTGDFEVYDPNDNLKNTKTYNDYAEAINKYNTELSNTTTPDGTPPKLKEATPEDFKQFIKDNPLYYQELSQTGHLQAKYEPLSSEELTLKRFEKAGIKDPKDIEWYNNYAKSNFSPDVYNQNLLRFVYGNQDALTSRGKLSDKYYNSLANFAGTLGLTPITPNTTTQQTTTQKTTNEKPRKLGDLKVSELNTMSYYDLINNFSTEDISKNIDKLPKTIQDQLYLQFPDWKPEEETTSGTTKSGRSGRRRSGRRLSGVNTKTAYDSDLKLMSDIGLKNSDVDFNDWDEKDKRKYTQSMNKIKELTGKTEQEIWDMVGDYESRKYKTGKTNKTTFEDDGTNTGMTADQEWNEVMKIYNQLASQVQNGQMKQVEAINIFTKWYQDNKSFLLPETVTQIEKYIDEYF